MATKYQPGEQFTVDGKTYTTPSGSGFDAILVEPGATETAVDTSQPSPTTIQQSQDLFKVPTASVGPGGEPIFDIFRQGETEALKEADFSKMGVNVTDIKEGQAPTGFKSKFETGFQEANKALGDAAKDVSGIQGTSLVNQYSPTRRNDFSSMFVQSDPFVDGLVKTWQ